MTDTFSAGTQSVIQCLTPSDPGWREVPMDQRYSMGYPSHAFTHESNLAVISAVEVVSEPGMDKGFEYHLSISKQLPNGTGVRCESNEAKWVLGQFGLDAAEEDNHVPHGYVRNFWRPVASGLVGIECPSKAEEPAIKEDKGDFIWGPAP